MSKRASTAAVGYLAVAAFLFAVAFTASSLPGNGPTIAQIEDASAQAQIAREEAAKRLARTAKRSSPMFTATPKDSSS